MDTLREKSIADLKSIMRAHGLSLANIFEKEEMISRLVESGKLRIETDSDAKAAAEFSSISNQAGSSRRVSTERFELSRTLLSALPIHEIKSIMSSYGIDSSGCYERCDLIERIASSNSVQVLDE